MKSNYWTWGGIALVLVLGVALTSNKTEAPNPVEVQPAAVKAFELPAALDFAGEAVPMDELDIQERFDRELLVNTYWQSNNLLLLKRSHKYFPIIEPILAQHGVPNDFKYLALIESGLQNVVSPAGAAGYWQIMKKTGIELDLQINSEVDERFHLEKSTHAACSYLLEAKEKMGSWTLAAAAYNMGMSGASRRIEEQGVQSYYDLHLNSETARYVFRILAVKHLHENLANYGTYFDPVAHGWNLPEFTVHQVTGPVSSWITWSQDRGSNYKTLLKYNPWIKKSSLTNSSNKTYTVYLPKS